LQVSILYAAAFLPLTYLGRFILVFNMLNYLFFSFFSQDKQLTACQK